MRGGEGSIYRQCGVFGAQTENQNRMERLTELGFERPCIMWFGGLTSSCRRWGTFEGFLSRNVTWSNLSFKKSW